MSAKKPPASCFPGAAALPRWSALAALTGSCLLAGCAGVHVLPDGTAACSEDAIAETRRLGIPPEVWFTVELYGLPGSTPGAAIIRDGPIEVGVPIAVKARVPEEILRSPICTEHGPSWVVPPECQGEYLVSVRAVMYGEVNTRGERVQIRLHEFRDGALIQPFCGLVAQHHRVSELGLEKNPPALMRALRITRPPPGTVVVVPEAEVLIVTDNSQMPPRR